MSFINLIEGGKQNFVTQSDILNKLYPIGSIYLSYENASPASKLGGGLDADNWCGTTCR